MAQETPTERDRTDQQPASEQASDQPASEGVPATSPQQLIQAAAKVFARDGYAGASVDKIAAEAGFSKGAVYWNFASKEDLFLALFEQRIDEQVDAMIRFVSAAPPATATASEVNRRFVDLLERDREMVLLAHEYWAVSVRDPELQERYVERYGDLRRNVADGLTQRHDELGAPPFPMSAEDVATGLISLAWGLSIGRLADPDAVPDDLYGELVSLIYEGLEARARAAVEEED
jgi:AcrR family transcriptional regulator